MKFGSFEIYSILDGFFRLDGGAMFGRVPKEVWKKTNPPDKKNRIALALRCLLIKTGKRNILVDTGIGDKYDKKFFERFAIYLLEWPGFWPEDIDIVINTHLHFDHCGGNTMMDGKKIIPVFPRAKYFVQKGEWEAANSENILTRASYLRQDFLPLEETGQLELIEDEVFEIEPGVNLIRTGGHTKNHQIVRIESQGKTAVYLGDLVPTATHLNYPFIMGYDVEPLETAAKKMEILPKLAQNKTLLIFEHEPKYSAALVGIKDNKISVSAEVRL